MTATLPYTHDTHASAEAEPLGVTLSAVHDRWLQHLAAALAPALSPRSRFQERWDVSRCFADEFQPRFRTECALVESLGGRLPPVARVRLATLRAALERTGNELEQDVRQQRRPGSPAMLARRLLELARYWCAELEFATTGVTRDDLPQPGRILLERIA